MRRHLEGDTWRPFAEELLGLLWLTVKRAEYIADELLALSFDDGSSLEVKANPQWEAWRFMRADGSQLVCAPDGGLFTWSPDSPGGRARPYKP